MNVRFRHDAIVRSLRRNGTFTVDALAEEVGASRRTVLRDISALRDEGYVIHSDVGRGGGLRLDPQSVQTNARLLAPEVFALLNSVAAMRAAENLPFSELADAGLPKIEKALPSDKVKDLRAFLECLHISQLSPQQDLSGMSNMDPGLLPAFETAFLGRHFIRSDHRVAKGHKTSREVEPQAMLILPPLWYLVGWDPLHADFRHFRMDRISQPEAVADTHFVAGMCRSKMTSVPTANCRSNRRGGHPCDVRHPALWAFTGPSGPVTARPRWGPRRGRG